MIKNKCGYELLEYIKFGEHELNKYENITESGVVFRYEKMRDF